MLRAISNGRLPTKFELTHLITSGGQPMKSVHGAWKAVARSAGAKRKIGPHMLRHSAATWLMTAGTVPVHEIARYLGMSVDVLMEVYWQHIRHFQGKAASVASAESLECNEYCRRRPEKRIIGRPMKQANREGTGSGRTHRTWRFHSRSHQTQSPEHHVATARDRPAPIPCQRTPLTMEAVG
jgi:hypothetical protein